MAVHFSVKGHSCFLSHLQMMKVFALAIVRGQLRIIYSQGFNPRPKMSLVLPKSVAVESDDEILLIKVESSCNVEEVKQKLIGQIPDGIDVLDIEIVDPKNKPKPLLAHYLFETDMDNDKLNNDANSLLNQKSIVVNRRKKANVKKVDVRKYIKTLTVEQGKLKAQCLISNEGSVRIDEIMNLMNIATENLTSPVKRTKVLWH